MYAGSIPAVASKVSIPIENGDQSHFIVGVSYLCTPSRAGSSIPAVASRVSIPIENGDQSHFIIGDSCLCTPSRAGGSIPAVTSSVSIPIENGDRSHFIVGDPCLCTPSRAGGGIPAAASRKSSCYRNYGWAAFPSYFGDVSLFLNNLVRVIGGEEAQNYALPPVESVSQRRSTHGCVCWARVVCARTLWEAQQF
ncbi:MAG: hypothetical protein AAFR20_05685 [Pseudomonadota bacterium]